MKAWHWNAIVVISLSVGCASGRLAECDRAMPPVEPVTTAASTAATEPPIRLAAGAEPMPASPEQAAPLARRFQPEFVSPPIEPPILAAPGRPLTLEDLEALALGNNPTLAQAAARVAAAEGQAYQSGLWPNPELAYQANEIGQERQAGQQGFYVSQEFVMGGKLRLSRRAAEQVAQQRQFELSAQRLRVLNDVRTQFYEVLAAQLQADLARERVQFLATSADRTERLQKVGEASRIEVLQLRIDRGQAHLTEQNLRNRYAAAWRSLAALMGVPEQQPAPLEGQLMNDVPQRDWPTVLGQVLANSPELAAVTAEINQASWALERARVEPVPNVTALAGPQYDNATGFTVTNVQVSMPIPVFNRNQGGISKAQAELVAAQRKLNSVQLALQARVAGAYERYANARRQVEGYSQDIEPKARDARNILEKYFQKEQDLPTLMAYLASQRTLFDTQLAYLTALKELRQSVIALDGLVLTGSLATNAAE